MYEYENDENKSNNIKNWYEIGIKNWYWIILKVDFR